MVTSFSTILAIYQYSPPQVSPILYIRLYPCQSPLQDITHIPQAKHLNGCSFLFQLFVVHLVHI